MLFSFFKFCLVFFFFWKTGAEELRKSIKVITSKCFNKDRSIFTYECFSQFGCFYGKGTNETHFTATICVTLLVCSVQYRACCPCCKSCSLYLSHLYGMGRWKLYVMWQPAKKYQGEALCPQWLSQKTQLCSTVKAFPLMKMADNIIYVYIYLKYSILLKWITFHVHLEISPILY